MALFYQKVSHASSAGWAWAVRLEDERWGEANAGAAPNGGQALLV